VGFLTDAAQQRRGGETVPRPTPFHSRTSALGVASRWEEWDGYLSPTMFDLDHLQEYIAVRTGCALFDVSPLYKYDVRGRDAPALMNRVIVRDVAKCRVGQVLYTCAFPIFVRVDSADVFPAAASPRP
jgi:aminomethyltransferase